MDIEAGKEGDFNDSIPEALQSTAALHDPFEWYAEQRRDGPVHYDSYRGVYDVFTCDHVRTSLQEDELLVRKKLSDHSGKNPFAYLDKGMVWTDGTDHKQTKAQLFKYFRPSMLANLEASIEAIATEQLEQVLAEGTTFDFVDEFADPVPLRVIMDVVGIPREDQHQMLAWLNTFREVMNSEYSAEESSEPGRMAEPVDYFRELVARRAADPQDDLISQLATETELDSEVIGANCFDFILAGHGTMAEFLSNALYLFVTHNLVGQHDQYDLDVVLEEVLRHRSPLQSRARQTTAPVTIADTEIPAGETVILWLGAANRDPAKYDDPGTFVPDRDPDHLAFGNGPHTCIGAPLARLEGPILMRTVLEQFADVELQMDGAEPMSKASKLGFQTLPVTVEKA